MAGNPDKQKKKQKTFSKNKIPLKPKQKVVWNL